MPQQIIINLGKGELRQGFPAVTAQLYDKEKQIMQLTGSLPAIPSLDTLYQHWQLQYKSFYNNFSWRQTLQHPEFEIDEDDESIANISHTEFRQICENLQTQFNYWLTANSFLDIERKLRTHLAPHDEICLIIVAPINILTLPWCLWDLLSDYPQAEIALSPPEYAQPFKTNNQKGAKKQVKILSILGDSTGINIGQDQKILEKLPSSAITFLTEPTSSQLNEQLWQAEWDILFFAGHSSSQGKGHIQINSTETLTVEQLKYGLRKAISNGLKLAIFNSCDGLGLAQDLASLHLPQIIVMRLGVPDKVAQEFLKHFLAAFAGGKSVYIAVREAREKLQGLEAQFPCATWLPVICQNPVEIPPTWIELSGQNPIQLLPPRRLLKKILLCSLASTLLVGGMRFLGLLSPVELWSFDMLMRLRIPEKSDDRILVVTVTPEDIQGQDIKEPRFGSLADSTLNRLLVYLQKYEPAVIGLDIYRDYPSRKPELALALKNPHLIGVCKRPDAKDDPTGTLPSPEMRASQLGFSDFVQDYDSAIRRHLLFMTPNTTSRCTAPYAFSTQLAFKYLFTKNKIKAEFNSNGHLQLGKIVFPSIGARTSGYQGVDAGGNQVLLNYRATSDPLMVAQKVTLKDIFSNKVNPEAIKNRIILIGITDLSAGDYWPTPYGAGSSQKIPGVIIHAHMVSQILSAVLDKRPLLSVWSWQEIIWIASWSILGGFIAWRFQTIMIMGTAVSGTVIILCGTCWLLLNTGVWAPLIPPFLSLILTNGAVVYLILSNKEGS